MAFQNLLQVVGQRACDVLLLGGHHFVGLLVQLVQLVAEVCVILVYVEVLKLRHIPVAVERSHGWDFGVLPQSLDELLRVELEPRHAVHVALLLQNCLEGGNARDNLVLLFLIDLGLHVDKPGAVQQVHGLLTTLWVLF